MRKRIYYSLSTLFLFIQRLASSSLFLSLFSSVLLQELLSEIVSAERTFRVDFEPSANASLVEMMQFIARQHCDFLIDHVRHSAYRTVMIVTLNSCIRVADLFKGTHGFLHESMLLELLVQIHRCVVKNEEWDS